ARADPPRRAADPTPKRDTPARAPNPAPAVAARQAPAAAPPAAAAGSAPDTSRIRKLLRQRPTPFDRLVVQVREKLVPGSKYLIRARGATNLNGASTDGQAVLAVAVPKPSSLRDTVPAPPPPPPPHPPRPPPPPPPPPTPPPRRAPNTPPRRGADNRASRCADNAAGRRRHYRTRRARADGCPNHRRPACRRRGTRRRRLVEDSV